MSKLADQQIEAAAKACYEAQFLPNDYLDKKIGSMWDLLADHCKANYRRSVVAAAPFLQLPWSPLSDAEWDSIVKTIGANRNRIQAERFAVDFLIELRNAKLALKPADPRVTMLVDFFHKNHKHAMAIPEFAKEILELLDRKE